MKKLFWVMSAMGLMALGGCVVDPTYTYCGSSDECQATETCYEVTTSSTSGAFCSAECTSSGQCENNFGFSGQCMNVDGIGGICFQTCDFDSDCFSTSGCYDFTDADGFTDSVCLPQTL